MHKLNAPLTTEEVAEIDRLKRIIHPLAGMAPTERTPAQQTELVSAFARLRALAERQYVAAGGKLPKKNRNNNETT